MADIRWVCLSDTHFGAENSLLSHVRPDDASVDPDRASPVLTALVACLRELVDSDSGVRLPTLVLNGDILELALAEDNVAAMVFDRFIDLAFDPDHPIFDPVILFVPGNHDHHLWETARERMYADYVARTPPGDELEAPYHATTLYVERSTHHLEAELLTALVRRRQREHLSVRILYPNLGLESKDSDRQVLIHHGHFTESIYRLISSTKAAVFPRQPLGSEVWDWEADNFAWIDFFWSTLGRSGSAGQDVGLVYDMLQSEEAIRRLATGLGDFAGNHARPTLRFVARPLARAIAGELAGRIQGRERQHPEVALTEKGWQGLSEYLAGPVALQFDRYRNGASGERVSFVFGHTHKPFESTLDAPGFPAPVSVYNSGGWVVDTVSTASSQGAALILIDVDCNVASIRMYNQASSPDQSRVRLQSAADAAPNALVARLASELDFDRPVWQEFSETVAGEVPLRHHLLPMIIQRGLQFTRP